MIKKRFFLAIFLFFTFSFINATDFVYSVSDVLSDINCSNHHLLSNKLYVATNESENFIIFSFKPIYGAKFITFDFYFFSATGEKFSFWIKKDWDWVFVPGDFEGYEYKANRAYKIEDYIQGNTIFLKLKLPKNWVGILQFLKVHFYEKSPFFLKYKYDCVKNGYIKVMAFSKYGEGDMKKQRAFRAAKVIAYKKLKDCITTIIKKEHLNVPHDNIDILVKFATVSDTLYKKNGVQVIVKLPLNGVSGLNSYIKER